NFFTEVIPKEAQATAKKAFEECIKKKKVVNYSLSAEMPNGKTRFFHNSMIPVVESGKIIRVLCSSKDETQFREIEKDVHLQASIFNIVFQHAREHILIISKEGIVLDVNYT